MLEILFIRGFWLIFLELTFVSLAWTFYPGLFIAGVLWAIGWSMVFLSLLIYLPLRVLALFGLLLIFGHNLFDTLPAQQFGTFSWLWAFFHERAMFLPLPRIRFFLVYPLIPWLGVMLFGYSFGHIFTLPKTQRLLWFRNLGWSFIFSFVFIRGINLYGDPQPWSIQSTFLKTILSFFNCHKYPPSLVYLLITLGLAFFLLYLFETKPISILKPLIIFGRVPLFFYLVHLWLIHFSAIFLAFPQYGFKAFILPYLLSSSMPDNYGYDLHHVYFLWLVMLAILYPLCNWFNHYKLKNKHWWLSYL